MANEYDGPERRKRDYPPVDLIEEQRAGYCPVHHQKCKEINLSMKSIEDLKQSKLSIRMFQIIVAIAFALGAGSWYKADSAAQNRFLDSMKHQEELSVILIKHVKASNDILKRMSHDVRESKINQDAILKKLGLERLVVPYYYGDNDEDKID